MPNTTTGTFFERFIEEQLDDLGVHHERQYKADGLNATWSYIDIVTLDNFESPLAAISLKDQRGGGTADEKIPFEALSLSRMCENHNIPQGFIVLSGPGWSETKLYWYLNDFKTPHNVRIISYDQFEEEVLTKN